jgi:hypothetical protein
VRLSRDEEEVDETKEKKERGLLLDETRRTHRHANVARVVALLPRRR